MKRISFLVLLWALSAGACACVIGQMLALASGRELAWQHRNGIKRTVVTMGGGSISVARVVEPKIAQLPNETDLGSRGHPLRQVSFWLGFWQHNYHAAYYSPIPNDTYDPKRLSQYRYALQYDVKALILDAWLCALLLALLPVAFLLVSLRRFFLSRRAFVLSHCRVCGYDLRATPERCPECGAVADMSLSGCRVAPVEGGLEPD